MLSIFLFGVVRVANANGPPLGPLTHSAQALLAYLVLHRRRLHPREVLGEMFWSGHPEGSARHCLSTALWRLRRALEPPGVAQGTYVRTTSSGEIGFNADSDYWLDVADFENGVSRVPPRPLAAIAETEIKAVRQALDLYTADLLEAFYDDWALRERERLRLLYLDALERLMRYNAAVGSLDDAVECGRRIVGVDPLREEIHREIMRLYARVGRRALAVQQFGLCRAILAQELDIAPMPETQTLYNEITQAGATRSSEPLGPPSSRRALTPIRLAVRGVDQVRLELRRAIHFLEQWEGQDTTGPES